MLLSTRLWLLLPRFGSLAPARAEPAPISHAPYLSAIAFVVPQPASIEDFDRWSENEKNWEAWEKFMDSPKLEEWCNAIE